MLIMNGLVGGCMLIGTWRRSEVTFNADSALTYLPMLITLATITLVLPRFTQSATGGWMSNSMEVFVGGGSLVLYGSFLWLQSSRYRGYFAVGHPEAAVPAEHVGHISVPKAITLLLVSLLIVVICAVAATVAMVAWTPGRGNAASFPPSERLLPATTRISPYIYNDTSDIDEAVAGIVAAQEFFSGV
jgi:Ca2+:H+ antiporter